MCLQRMAFLVDGRRNVREQCFEERAQIVGQVVRGRSCATCSGVAIDDRELDLGLVGIEIEEQLVDLVDHRLDSRIGPVDLVDDEDHGQSSFECLAQDEPRLRQRALARVDEQQHAVHHGECALDLPAEIGVSGRVDDVDLDVAETNRRVLGQDRDALLTLEIHRVEDSFGDVLVRPERSGLPEHRVHEGRLAVVDVGDDRDVTEVVSGGHATRVATLRLRGSLPEDHGPDAAKVTNPADRGLERCLRTGEDHGHES